MQMVGANAQATALPQQPLPGRVNYFIGKDRSQWHAGVPTFGKVGFQGVYKGIDLVYYGNQSHLEYDFVVAPHADPKQIQLHFAGAKGVHINANGELVVQTAGRELKWQKPTVYQEDAAGKHTVAARFRLKTLPNGQAGVSFALGRYDTARPLVIDPILLYSTYLGGNAGSSLGDLGYAIAVDSNGNAYVAGATSSTDFPITSGAPQSTNKQGQFETTAFVAKLNPAGTALIYATYLGGSGDNKNIGGGDWVAGLAIDSNGNAYMAGNTNSADFPVTPGAFQQTKSATATLTTFVAKLDPTGTSLVYSTCIGGSGASSGNGGGGDGAHGIAVDSSGAAYIGGFTYSTDFPVTPGAFQTTIHQQAANFCNGFVTKLNPAGSALLYSTYLGGSGQAGGNQGAGDNVNGLAIDPNGNAYVTGGTYSADFPTTSGVVQPLRNGATNATNLFVTKLNPTGTALIYSTYLGRAGDYPYAMALDSKGNVCVTGVTYNPDFPTTIGAWQRGNTKQTPQYMSNAFVTEVNSTGTALLYSTYLSGGFNGGNGDAGQGVVFDGNGNIYVTGSTNSADFPATTGAFQTTKSGNVNSRNVFITKLSPALLFPDFNNDGFTDLLLQNASTGEIGSWYMQGGSRIGGALFSLTPPTDYALVGVGDFGGNGSGALVLQSKTTNKVAFRYTSGTNSSTIPDGIFLNTTPEAGWKVMAVGDFNGDGKSDLVFQNQTTRQISIWFMNGYLYQGGVLLPFVPLEGWILVGAGDLNVDGFPDLVFQNQTSGQVALWFMNGTTYSGGTVMSTVPDAGWRVVGVGDYNGDGNADLVFQNVTSGQAVVWYLKNGVKIGGNTFSAPLPTGWNIVGPR